MAKTTIPKITFYHDQQTKKIKDVDDKYVAKTTGFLNNGRNEKPLIFSDKLYKEMMKPLYEYLENIPQKEPISIQYRGQIEEDLIDATNLLVNEAVKVADLRQILGHVKNISKGLTLLLELD